LKIPKIGGASKYAAAISFAVMASQGDAFAQATFYTLTGSTPGVTTGTFNLNHPLIMVEQTTR
jgi:hypothetical protein